jgi:hypothetical protein
MVDSFSGLKSILFVLGVDIWESLIFWRAMALVLMFGAFLTYIFRDDIKNGIMREQRIKHDKELFQLLDLIMPELKFFEAVERLEKDNVYDLNSLHYIDKFRSLLNQPSKQFLNPKIKKASQGCLKGLDELRDFMDKNFILFPKADDQTKPLMYPNPEIDGGGNEGQKDTEKFLQFTNKLNDITAKTKKCYSRYRAAVKQIIYI